MSPRPVPVEATDSPVWVLWGRVGKRCVGVPLELGVPGVGSSTRGSMGSGEVALGIAK